jgi:hypothetical protein
LVAFSKILPGDVLWDCHRTKMGNTSLKQMSCWKVHVISTDEVTGSAMCSWNGNTPTRWSESRLKKLRRTPVKTK